MFEYFIKEKYKLNDDEWKQKRNEKVKERRQLNKEAYNAKQKEWRLRRLNKKEEIK